MIVMEVKGLSLPKICVPSGGLVFVFWFGYVTVFVFLWSIMLREYLMEFTVCIPHHKQLSC